MTVTGSSLDQRVTVLRLDYDPQTDTYAWKEDRRTWAAAKQDTGRNLFSTVGIGARGVTFTLRRNRRLTLFHAIRWRSWFCFLTAILDSDPGFVEIKAALCEPVECRKDADQETPGCSFPGILTEKYAGHQQLDPQAEVTGDFVLVTPKTVALAPGSWVSADGVYYLVRVPHEQDACKNEYEVRRKVDC